MLREIDPRLSARARDMLERGGLRRIATRWASREALEEALVARGLEPSAAVLEFEESFGGLVFSVGKDVFELGVQLPEEDEASEDDEDGDVESARSEEGQPPAEGGLVPCGTGWSREYDLLIGPSGAIYAAHARTCKRSSSALKLIEQLAMQWRLGSLRYTVRVRPPASAALAEALRLDPVHEATDACESWWEDADILMLQAHEPGDARRDMTFVCARRIERVTQVLEAARLGRDDAGFAISDREASRDVRKMGSPAPDGMPPPEQWQAHPEARRFRYDGGRETSGDVWVIGGPGHPRIEQYRVYKGKIREWSTFSDGGSFERSW
ncbi:hypothetical protein [Sorangium sp. So ce542]|uniref:hypothetical protein n=1 Tax=Sorangium sp. So ce542 TaxID=3133316 RepID=UPI003F5F45E6